MLGGHRLGVGRREGPEAPVRQAAVEHRREQRRRVGIGQAAGQLHLQALRRVTENLAGHRSHHLAGVHVGPDGIEDLRRQRREVHRRGHHAALQARFHVLGDLGGGAPLGLVGHGREMRRQNGVLELVQGRVGAGLGLEGVHSHGCDLAGGHEIGQGVHVENAAAGRVHEHDAVLHGGELVGADAPRPASCPEQPSVTRPL